jgi:hypothetical protein
MPASTARTTRYAWFVELPTNMTAPPCAKPDGWRPLQTRETNSCLRNKPHVTSLSVALWTSFRDPWGAPSLTFFFKGGTETRASTCSAGQRAVALRRLTSGRDRRGTSSPNPTFAKNRKGGPPARPQVQMRCGRFQHERYSIATSNPLSPATRNFNLVWFARVLWLLIQAQSHVAVWYSSVTAGSKTVCQSGQNDVDE